MTFVKGRTGNARGRPPLAAGMVIGKLSSDVKLYICELAGLPVAKVKALYEDSTQPILNAALAGIFLKAKNKSCESALSFLLDRVIGKPDSQPANIDVKLNIEDLKGPWQTLATPNTVPTAGES